MRDDDIKNRISNIDVKLDRLMDINLEQNQKLSAHDIRFAEYNGLLDKHIEGVILNREEIRRLDKDLVPIKAHVIGMEYIKKAVIFGGTVLGIVIGGVTLLKHFGVL